jgi:hypothetical protein
MVEFKPMPIHVTSDAEIIQDEKGFRIEMVIPAIFYDAIDAPEVMGTKRGQVLLVLKKEGKN